MLLLGERNRLRDRESLLHRRLDQLDRRRRSNNRRGRFLPLRANINNSNLRSLLISKNNNNNHNNRNKLNNNDRNSNNSNKRRRRITEMGTGTGMDRGLNNRKVIRNNNRLRSRILKLRRNSSSNDDRLMGSRVVFGILELEEGVGESGGNEREDKGE